MTEKETEVVGKEDVKFTKEQLLNSKRFRANRDALSALLDENTSYSIEETEKILTNFMKGKVK